MAIYLYLYLKQNVLFDTLNKEGVREELCLNLKRLKAQLKGQIFEMCPLDVTGSLEAFMCQKGTWHTKGPHRCVGGHGEG